MHIKKEKINIDDSLRKKVKNIMSFLGLSEKIVKGNIISIGNTNLAYIEPHKLTIKDNTYLFFNNSNDVFINNLSNKIHINELENYIKHN